MKMVNFTLSYFWMKLCMNYKDVTVRKIDVSEGADVNKTSA